jgi:hypothetical protein
MNRTLAMGLISALLIASFAGTAAAQQPTIGPAQQRPNAGKSAKQAAQEGRNLNEDPARRIQQQRKKTADAIVDRYVGGFQSNLGLTDEQTQKLSVLLGRYIRQRLMLAERRIELYRQLKEMIARQAPEDQIQSQHDQLVLTDRQVVNVENAFYNGINPQLTALQRGKLRVYIEETGQAIGQAIQKSTQ